VIDERTLRRIMIVLAAVVILGLIAGTLRFAL
jgi:hypothetical protein